MALFVLRKLILQTRMRSPPVGLDVWFLVEPCVYFHTSCVRTAKTLARLRGCAGSPESSLVAYVISTIISWAGSIIYIPQYDKHVNREFNFMNVGFCIAVNVWGMSIHKLSNNVNRLYFPKCHPSRAEKDALKWIWNELHYLKSNCCHVRKVLHIPYKVHMHMFQYGITCDCKQ